MPVPFLYLSALLFLLNNRHFCFFIIWSRPRFQFHTGHVTIGGSICTEVLTASGTAGSWQPTITMENLILLLHNLIGVDGAGRVDFGSPHHPSPHLDYSEAEVCTITIKKQTWVYPLSKKKTYLLINSAIIIVIYFFPSLLIFVKTGPCCISASRSRSRLEGVTF